MFSRCMLVVSLVLLVAAYALGQFVEVTIEGNAITLWQSDPTLAVLAGASMIAALGKNLKSTRAVLISVAILIWIVSYVAFGHQETVIVEMEAVRFWRSSEFLNGVATVMFAVGIARKD